MLKGKDLYWIYEMRPIVERTEDEFYKDMANSYADYLNITGTYMECGPYGITFKENEKAFSIYSGCDSSTEIAALVPVKCEDGVQRWYFEMQPSLLDIGVIRLADSLYQAIKTMEKQRP